MKNENPPRLSPAMLEQRALERWEGEGGALPIDPTPRTVTGRRNPDPKQASAVRKVAPAGKKDPVHEHPVGLS